MKVIRTTLYILGAILTVLLMLGFVATKNVTAERSIYIDTPKSLVFEEISILKHMVQWLPGAQGDTTAVFTFEGTAGTEGSSVSWKGNRSIGEANQLVEDIEALRYVETTIIYSSPYAHRKTYAFTLNDEGNGTRVTWRAEHRIPFPFNLPNLFIDPEARMLEEMEGGLANLRQRCERRMRVQEYKGFVIDKGFIGSKSYALERNTVPFGQKAVFAGAVFARLMANKELTDSVELVMPTLIIHAIDQRDSTFDLSAGFEILPDSSMRQSNFFTMDSVEVYTVEYANPQGRGVDEVYAALRNFIRFNGLEQERIFVEKYAWADSAGVQLGNPLSVSYVIESK